jgi:hypothetical protein
MSGHIGLREEARAGHLLARRIARLFAPARGGGQVQRKAQGASGCGKSHAL